MPASSRRTNCERWKAVERIINVIPGNIMASCYGIVGRSRGNVWAVLSVLFTESFFMFISPFM